MSSPKWLEIAGSKLGVAEVPGKGINPEIVKWIRDDLGYKWYTDDETPWCAGFANWVLKQAGEAVTDSLMARSFVKYGQKCDPKPGAILVFKRGAPPAGHVGFYVRETKTHFLVRGGNQGNRVSDSWYRKDSLIACRWPTRLSNSRTMAGAGMAGLGTASTTALGLITDTLQESAGMLQPLVDYSGYIQAAFLALTFAGIGLVTYARWTDARQEKASLMPEDE